MSPAVMSARRAHGLLGVGNRNATHRELVELTARASDIKRHDVGVPVPIRQYDKGRGN
ncbi:hypothetical protein D3C84_980090 [compost metagenome]